MDTTCLLFISTPTKGHPGWYLARSGRDRVGVGGGGRGLEGQARRACLHIAFGVSFLFRFTLDA